MSTFGTRKQRGSDDWSGRIPRSQLDLDVLMTKELHAHMSMASATPVSPEKRFRPNNEWMQEHTSLARLRSGTAMPLALFAQWAGTATANAGAIHHAQAAIGALFGVHAG